MNLKFERELHVRKPLVTSTTQLAGGVILKMLKYFKVKCLTFCNSSACEKSKNLDWAMQISFYESPNRVSWFGASLVSASFFFLLFRVFMKKLLTYL